MPPYSGIVLRVLLVAPHLDGTDVGEAWVAHQWATRLAERHSLTVLTARKHGAPDPQEQVPGATVVQWPEPPLLHRAERFNSIVKPGYPLFHARARRWLRRELAAGRSFDVAHQATPVAARYPTPLAGLGVPYLVGPLGGSLASPEGFRADEGTAPWWMNLRAVDRFRLRHDPFLRRGLTDAAVVLGIAPYVRELLDDVPLRRFEVMYETGLTDLPPEVDRTGRTGTVRLLFVGRLVRTKGARDAVRAMAELRDLDVHLDVVGTGPDGATCETEAMQLGVADRVTFHGRLPRVEVDEFYRRADVFVFPSYREAGGNVQYEAMAWGLPLVVGARGGTEAAVVPECGVLVPPVEPRQYALGVADAVRDLARDPQRRMTMGRAAREHAERTGLWESKIDAVGHLYDEVAARPSP